ncbi:hypothetical protein G6F65_017281 [Rhizopus arrhizus]|nr:hypothetical protein G6F65_017281 [Rhizopus arrhizus]
MRSARTARADSRPNSRAAQAADAQVRVAVAGDPAQLRTHARFEFVQRERLDQIVIGTEVEHAHAFGQAIARGHHQYRQAITALAQALQHIAAVQLRQAQVQHQQRVLGGAQRSIGVRAIVDVVDHMPLPAQRGAQAGGNVRAHRMDGVGLSAAEGSRKPGEGGAARGGWPPPRCPAIQSCRPGSPGASGTREPSSRPRLSAPFSMNSSSPFSPFLMLLSIAITRSPWKLLTCGIEVWPTTMRFSCRRSSTACTPAVSRRPSK